MGLLRAAVLGFVLLAAFAAVASAQTTSSSDPQLVVDSFEHARSAGDVDGALASLSDTAVITIANQTTTRSFSGSVQLRTYLQTMGTRFQTLMRSRSLVQGTSVTWTERDQVGSEVLDTSVVAIVSAGQIVAITYRDTNPPGTPGRFAPLPVQHRQFQVPTVAWPAGLAVVGLALVTFVFGRPRRKARSDLDGRLLVALRRERQLDYVERKKAA